MLSSIAGRSRSAGPVMAEPIRFLLNGLPVAVEGIAPQITLLEYLREVRALTGTKEGCAEGDCGACTVVVAERCGDRLAWKPINACIRLLPSVDGKAVFTVEGLRAADGALHPVQQAMVEAHATQCGFCTPGFVMSLFALYKGPRLTQREAVCDALAGNLCRCTGYRPILDAAQSMYDLPAPSGWRAPATGAPNADEKALMAALDAIGRTAMLDYAAGGQRWLAPRTLADLTQACARMPGAELVAGATDVALRVTKQHQALGDLVYVGDVEALRLIRATPEGLVIGAAASLEDAFAALDESFPELHEAWVRFASPAIRAGGTLGGNVANGSPIGDSMPALIALGAHVTLASARGTRSTPLEDFYLGYRKTARATDEVLVDVRVPPRAPGLVLRAYKVAKRYDQDISGVFACFALTRAGERVATARIGCGGVAAVPARARATESALTGQPWRRETFVAAGRRLAAEFTPIDDMRASARYRRTVLGNLLERLWYDTDASTSAPVRLEALSAVDDPA
jgi:xanthine dehydrogenase small subunit